MELREVGVAENQNCPMATLAESPPIAFK
jgi:hypothetical protein